MLVLPILDFENEMREFAFLFVNCTAVLLDINRDTENNVLPVLYGGVVRPLFIIFTPDDVVCVKTDTELNGFVCLVLNLLAGVLFELEVDISFDVEATVEVLNIREDIFELYNGETGFELSFEVDDAISHVFDMSYEMPGGPQSTSISSLESPESENVSTN